MNNVGSTTLFELVPNNIVQWCAVFARLLLCTSTLCTKIFPFYLCIPLTLSYYSQNLPLLFPELFDIKSNQGKHKIKTLLAYMTYLETYTWARCTAGPYMCWNETSYRNVCPLFPLLPVFPSLKTLYYSKKNLNSSKFVSLLRFNI